MQAKSLLYARRIKGDLDLGLEPARIDPAGNRRWAQLVAPGGLLPGGTPHGVLEVSAAQNYRAGTKLEIDDRKYRYCQADLTRQLRCGYGAYPMVAYGETGVPTAQANAGTYVISLTAVAAIDADEYAEGYLVIAYAGAQFSTRHKILSNTVAAAPGAVYTVTVYDAFVANVTVGLNVTLFHSPWREIHCMRQEVIDLIVARWQYVSFVGVPNIMVPLANWFWLQYSGPCLCIESGGDEGALINDRDMHFDTNGAIMRQSYVAADHYQRAGYILPHTEAGNMPNGVGEIFLQLGD